MLSDPFAAGYQRTYNAEMKSEGRVSFGPGALVTAAFIGPGTVTTATLAGANFGYALLWGMLFSTLATYILQEMSSRLGIITRQGLGEALRLTFPRGFKRLLSLLLVISAIALGNAAYQAGNITGAALGINALTGDTGPGMKIWPLIIGLLAAVLLFIGSYKLLERALVGLVILMSLTFITTAVIIGPDLGPLLKGLFLPSIPPGSLLTLIGLIGTTVVPYNLFLHASAVSEHWQGPRDLRACRLDSVAAIGLGGLISMSIMVTSAHAFHAQGTVISGASDLTGQLKPLLGSWAPLSMGLGLLAAGLTSAITAPLAAAYACRGILGWEKSLKSGRFRAVWMGVLLTGLIFANLGFKPLQIILFAQAANGLLLPIIAGYLLWIMNQPSLMKDHRNRFRHNLIGLLVVVVTLVLGIRSIVSVIARL